MDLVVTRYKKAASNDGVVRENDHWADESIRIGHFWMELARFGDWELSINV